MVWGIVPKLLAGTRPANTSTESVLVQRLSQLQMLVEHGQGVLRECLQRGILAGVSLLLEQLHILLMVAQLGL
jgi:hypothetical protein